MKKLLLTVIFVLFSTFAAAAGWQETDAKLVFKGMDVGLYDQAKLGSKKMMSISHAKFPMKVWYLETSSNRMHLIRLNKNGENYWVKGTRISMPAIEGKVKLRCENSVASKPGYSGRGLGNRSKCK